VLKYKARKIEKLDLTEILELEHHVNSYEDTEFERTGMRPWGLDKKRLLNLVKQRDSSAAGTFQSHVCVIETKVKNGWLTCGLFAYECRDDHYVITHMTLHKDAPKEDMVSYIIEWFKTKMRGSFTRRTLHVIIPDADQAHLKEKWGRLKSLGGAIKLVPSYYEDGTDAWDVSIHEKAVMYDDI
jgi:hypothetical protein